RDNIQAVFEDIRLAIETEDASKYGSSVSTLMVPFPLSDTIFSHLCGISLLKKYIYHDKYFRRGMYVLKDNGLIQPKPPHNTLEFWEGVDGKNLAEIAEPTDHGRLIVKLRKKDIPPELLEDKENLKVDPSTL